VGADAVIPHAVPQLPAVRALVIRLGLCRSICAVATTSLLLSVGTTLLILERLGPAAGTILREAMTISTCVPLLVAPPATWLVARLILRAEYGRQRAHRLASTDPLTGAVNRRQFFAQGQQELMRATRSNYGVALLLLDLDFFKRINDTHGHAAGDTVLKATAECCAGHLRPSDILVRLGGEEFAILLSDVTEAQALQAAERVRLSIEALVITVAGGAVITPTVSIGVSCNHRGNSSLDELLAAADRAMYTAKREGRNRVSANVIPAGGSASCVLSTETSAAGAMDPSPLQAAGQMSAPGFRGLLWAAGRTPDAKPRARRERTRDSRVVARLSEAFSRSGRTQTVIWLTVLSIVISVLCGMLTMVGSVAMRDERLILMVLCVAVPALVVPPVVWVVATLSMEAETARRVAEVMAMTDPLTGLFNRRHFLDLAARESARVSRARQPLAVLMLDIDHFKTVNDTFGHATGDQVLTHVARICLGCTRQCDTLARLGGEEFAVLLPDTSMETALTIAERARAAVADDMTLRGPDGAPMRTTLSIGVATLAQGDDGIAAALDRADKAMYLAKSSGRNRVCAYGAG
jgi:diguanylate cyclase (GGDEF)-like protein